MRPRFSSQDRSTPRRPRATRSRCMDLEGLEGRELLTAISIGDATATEGGRFLGAFVQRQAGGLDWPKGLVFRGGDLFVASSNTDSVLRYDAASGRFLGEFVRPTDGGLDLPFDLAFDDDGYLYVSSAGTNEILRYSPTGAFVGPYVSAGYSPLTRPRALLFGPDGNLYVASQDSDQVLRFQGPDGQAPGAFLDVFAETGNGSDPFGLAFGPDSNLYVSCVPSDGSGTTLKTGFVGRHSGATGDLIDIFVPTGSGGLSDARHLAFDRDGNLLVPDSELDTVLRFAGPGGDHAGAFLGALFSPGVGGLINPQDLALDGEGNVYVANSEGDEILRYGPATQLAFTVSLSAAGASIVTVDYATTNGTAEAGSDFVRTTGMVTFAPGETTKTIRVPTLSDTDAEPTETLGLTLFNAVGATVADGLGVGSILDGDASKFHVVDDSTTDATYEYDPAGHVVESHRLNGGNTAPRGAASTSAGDKVWVVDANKRVYVYNAVGGLLGSWTAGSLASNATVEGITTDGTDVWIVDARSDKVFRFANAAGRLSGSQNAAGSFSLNKSNTGPKDLVTDGTSLWVVDDSNTDKVFKYTPSGSLVGSWTIAGAGTSPTGITLDPAGGGALWVVDSGTDRVYQFDDARGRTSGSQSPSTSFALAAGNTNPQGIADPPVGASPPVSDSREVVSLSRRAPMAAGRPDLIGVALDELARDYPSPAAWQVQKSGESPAGLIRSRRQSRPASRG